MALLKPQRLPAEGADARVSQPVKPAPVKSVKRLTHQQLESRLGLRQAPQVEVKYLRAEVTPDMLLSMASQHMIVPQGDHRKPLFKRKGKPPPESLLVAGILLCPFIDDDAVGIDHESSLPRKRSRRTGRKLDSHAPVLPHSISQ